MNANDLSLLAKAGTELSTLLELTTGYPDDPIRMVRENREGVSIVADIFLRLVEEQAPVPASVAHLVVHLQRVANVFNTSAGGAQ